MWIIWFEICVTSYMLPRHLLYIHLPYSKWAQVHMGLFLCYMIIYSWVGNLWETNRILDFYQQWIMMFLLSGVEPLKGEKVGTINHLTPRRSLFMNTSEGWTVFMFMHKAIDISGNALRGKCQGYIGDGTFCACVEVFTC